MKARVPFAIFENGLEKLEMSGAKLSEALGFSTHAYIDWKNAGNIPKVAGIAIECLLRRNHLHKNDVVLRGDNIEVIDGIAKVKHLHGNLWLVELE